jgi:hypothetical protein
VTQGSQAYWLGSAAVAGVALLIVYAIAAALAARVASNQREGMVAATTAIIVGSVAYVAASLLNYVLLPGSSVTASTIAGVLVFEPVLGIIFVRIAFSVAQAAANAGERAGVRVVPERRA